MSGKRPSPSALSTTLARNHNHTPTVTQAHTSFSHLSPTSTHNSCTSSDISDRLNMPLPPTPPAEQTKRGTSGEPPTATAAAKPGAAKFGTSPTAPSFAAVVSSSSTAATARSPLHTMSFSPSISSAQHHHQDHQQKQEHAQSSANPVSSTHISTATMDDAQAHVRSASGSFSNSSKYHSPLANSPSSANTSQDSSSKHSAADSGNTGASMASRDLEHDNDFEGSESSDVEIYLDTLGLHDSAARMHVLVSTGKFQVSNFISCTPGLSIHAYRPSCLL